MTFWLSHAAVGLVKFPSVFAHNLLVLRLASEHSVNFALKYERRLVSRMQERLKAHESLSFSSLLERLDTRIVQSLEIEDACRLAREKPPRSDPPAPKAGARQHGRGSNAASTSAADTSRRPARTPSPRRQLPRQGARSRTRSARRGAPPASAQKATRKQVCFDFNPSAGRRCPLGARCTKEHLDTKDPALKARFDKAKAAFDLSQRGSR